MRDFVVQNYNSSENNQIVFFHRNFMDFQRCISEDSDASLLYSVRFTLNLFVQLSFRFLWYKIHTLIVNISSLRNNLRQLHATLNSFLAL